MAILISKDWWWFNYLPIAIFIVAINLLTLSISFKPKKRRIRNILAFVDGIVALLNLSMMYIEIDYGIYQEPLIRPASTFGIITPLFSVVLFVAGMYLFERAKGETDE